MYFGTPHFLKLVSLDVLPETIADTPFVVDETRAGGVVFEFAAEIADIEAEIIYFADVFRAPNLSQQKVMGKNPAT